MRSKKIPQAQNIKEIWGTLKRPNLRIKGIEEGENLGANSQKILPQNHRENFHTLNKEVPIKLYVIYKIPDRLD